VAETGAAMSLPKSYNLMPPVMPPAFAPPPPRRRGADPEQFLGGKIEYNVDGQDIEQDKIKDLIQDFFAANTPLTTEVINASDLPQEIKNNLIKRLEAGFVPPLKPDHDDDVEVANDVEDAEHDRIKGLIKDFVASNAPLTPEVINASDLPQEIKDNLIKRLEAGFVPPFKPDYDNHVEMDNHTNDGYATSSITTAIEKSAITSLTADASLFASDPIVAQTAEFRSVDSGISEFDFSDDGLIDETDTLLMMRHMMGTFPGDAITQGIPGNTNMNRLRDKIMKTMKDSSALGGGGRLDIDGDGMINPFSDGMMILKHIHGKGIETPGGLSEMPDFIKNPMRNMNQMQTHLKDPIGF
jgi:hypothetical protein